jgi:DNA-binding CsgD family transcriptional regulator
MTLRMICTDESLLNGPGYLIAGESYQVGRSSRCSFVVSDRSVSRFHAEVTVSKENVQIRDLDSRNGTYVDGVRIKEMDVQSGQSVRFGIAQFLIISHDDVRVSAHEISEDSTYFVENKPFLRPPALKHLSGAQRRVLGFLLTGLQEKEVATKLKISPNTVHNHVKKIYRKMGVNTRPELMALFIEGYKAPKEPEEPEA